MPSSRDVLGFKPFLGWSLPPPGSLKLNVDAAVDTFSRLIRIGAIIRDGIGGVVAALFTSYMSRFGAFLAECMAVREGLKFAREEGHMVNLVECDSLNIITAIHSRCSLGLESSIINDIVVNFSWLDNVSCYHVPRTGNKAAHSLARFALCSMSTMV
ncbi:Ribonuclease H-like domain containing protein [Trema orientale]|uniref:Ribonuclease H-like domain containing protein n=1 Tax=Trema orientale TaxID=63057 RepID=A0A2P5CLE8_TREOI|nr:Ribonuclease H-like domain containing protein [Trema orientale]